MKKKKNRFPFVCLFFKVNRKWSEAFQASLWLLQKSLICFPLILILEELYSVLIALSEVLFERVKRLSQIAGIGRDKILNLITWSWEQQLIYTLGSCYNKQPSTSTGSCSFVDLLWSVNSSGFSPSAYLKQRRSVSQSRKGSLASALLMLIFSV